MTADKQRILDLLDGMADGLRPEEDCPVCAGLSGWCEECAPFGAAAETLDEAWRRVDKTDDIDEALAIYMNACAEIAGADAKARTAVTGGTE
jgi:hypothetical protein